MNEYKSPSESRSIVITGVARGGTSMVASLCAHIGIPMGKQGPRYENPYLQWAVLAKRWDVVKLLIDEIQSSLTLWGWKLPALSWNLDQVSPLLGDPRYIFVTKDIVSIARRRGSPEDSKRFALLVGRTARAYENLAAFGRRTSSPTLFVSFEETVRDPNVAALAIARFCGVDESNADGAKEAIDKDGLKYRNGVYVPRDRDDLSIRLSQICTLHGVVKPEL